MTLEEAFALREREIISLAGGGGKTTLMFALANELSSHRHGILLTTTTKIWEPEASANFALFLSNQLPAIQKWVAENLDTYPSLLIAQERLEGGKLQGFIPQWVDEFFSLKGVSFIIVEADGAAGRPIKAPREGEPVLPRNTGLLIPVVGIDALGCPLDEPYVFHSQIAIRILRQKRGNVVTEDMITQLVKEIIKVRPDKSRVIPFINKIDIPGGLEKARNLARSLLNIHEPGMERVVLGQAQGIPRVKEIIESTA